MLINVTYRCEYPKIDVEKMKQLGKKTANPGKNPASFIAGLNEITAVLRNTQGTEIVEDRFTWYSNTKKDGTVTWVNGQFYPELIQKISNHI